MPHQYMNSSTTITSNQFLPVSFFVIAAWTVCTGLALAQPTPAFMHEGRHLTATYCTVCHNLDYVKMQPKMGKTQARDLWTKTVKKMVGSYGAEIPDQATERAIIKYLILQSEQPSAGLQASGVGDVDTSHTQTNSSPP